MLNYRPSLDRVFQALADPTRREIVERLAAAPASVSDLAAPFAMSLPAIHQHLAVLEEAGLVRSEKLGRVRTCSLAPEALSAAEQWFNQRRALWEARLDRLALVLAEEDAKKSKRRKKK